MTPIEEEAMSALGSVRMRIDSNGKRFFRDMESALRANPEFQLTIKQAKFLWGLVHLYRKQISHAGLRDISERVHFGEEVSGLFDLAAHRESAGRRPRPERAIIQKPTRYEKELARGEGKLKL